LSLSLGSEEQLDWIPEVLSKFPKLRLLELRIEFAGGQGNKAESELAKYL